MRLFIMSAAFILAGAASALAADDQTLALYKQAVTADVQRAMDEKVIPKMRKDGLAEEKIAGMVSRYVEGIVGCQMKTMAMYDAVYTEPAYEVVKKGGSYLDSKKALAAKMQETIKAGGPAAEALKGKISEVMHVGKGCMEDLDKKAAAQ